MCQILYNKLAPEFFKVSSTEEELKAISDKFHTCWKFPNSIGAIDGKRIIVKQPVKSGSFLVCIKYKGNKSVVLFAIFGPEY